MLSRDLKTSTAEIWTISCPTNTNRHAVEKSTDCWIQIVLVKCLPLFFITSLIPLSCFPVLKNSNPSFSLRVRSALSRQGMLNNQHILTGIIALCTPPPPPPPPYPTTGNWFQNESGTYIHSFQTYTLVQFCHPNTRDTISHLFTRWLTDWLLEAKSG